MNLLYGDGFGLSCHSVCLNKDFDELPSGVQGFLQGIRDDPDLRWGGDFVDANGDADPDPVHIDDRLNLNDPDEWEARFRALNGACEPDSNQDGGGGVPFPPP